MENPELSKVKSYSAIFYPDFSLYNDDENCNEIFEDILSAGLKTLDLMAKLEEDLKLNSSGRLFCLAAACKRLNILQRYAKYEDQHLLYDLSPRIDEYDFPTLSGINENKIARHYYSCINPIDLPVKPFLSVQFEFIQSLKSLKKVPEIVRKLREQGYRLHSAHIDIENSLLIKK